MILKFYIILRMKKLYQFFVNTGKRTEWSLIQAIIIRVIIKSDDCKAGVRFVNHESDYRQTSDDTKSTYQLIIKITRNKNTFRKYRVPDH